MGYATFTGRYLSVSKFVSVADVKEILFTREIKTRKEIGPKGASENRRSTKLMHVTVPIKVKVVTAALHPRWTDTLYRNLWSPIKKSAIILSVYQFNDTLCSKMVSAPFH
jgi:hypothetical protein